MRCHCICSNQVLRKFSPDYVTFPAKHTTLKLKRTTNEQIANRYLCRRLEVVKANSGDDDNYDVCSAFRDHDCEPADDHDGADYVDSLFLNQIDGT